ncbi:unnamed protein product, partial [Mesorhabditis spiculigera]
MSAREKVSADELAIYPGLRELSLRNNSIVHISNEVFTSLRSLERLDLSQNRILTLPPKVFASLGKLKSLDLSGNGVQLSGDTLHGLHSLEELRISRNGLSYLPPSVFRHSTELSTLHLDHNRLVDLPGSILSTLPKLKQLNARSNLLANIETGSFAENGLLEALDLSENMIVNIDDAAFNGLQNLRKLNLTNNQLVRLPGKTWQLPSLETLDLSGNLFVALETASFEGLPSLRALNLSNSRNLNTIHMGAFLSLDGLRWISLAGSQLSSISNTAFSPVPPLSHLDLSDNQLVSLPSTAVHWSRIRDLRLYGNPWECDCALRQLELKNTGAVCTSPESNTGLRVDSLSTCSPFRGLVVPLILGLVILVLAVMSLALAIHRRVPSKRTTSSLLVSSHDAAYAFDRPFISPPSTGSPHSPQSQESYYEAPTAAAHSLPYAPAYYRSLYGQLPSTHYTMGKGIHSANNTYRPMMSKAPPTMAPPPIPRVIPPLGQGLMRRDSGEYENEPMIDDAHPYDSKVVPSTRL